jgi:4-hydroxy-tetrahydrodipicolinate reductase
MDITILGDGPLGHAVASELTVRGAAARILGRPSGGRHRPADLGDPGVIVEASRAGAVVGNVAAALDAGGRRMVIATTGWNADRDVVEALLREHDAAAVAASNFSLGVALFARLVDEAVALFGPLEAFDPYLVEWHRRTKADRPSGTAGDLARRIIAAHPRKHRLADPAAGHDQGPDALEVCSIRAGDSPGMHLVGFDTAGETVELRLTARDRSAYAAGILAAADWLARERRTPGLHSFESVVDELLAAAVAA